MTNLTTVDKVKTPDKGTIRFNYVMRKIMVLEKKIESKYKVGDIKVRTTGKIRQFIWKKIDFLEFNKQPGTQMIQEPRESKPFISPHKNSQVSQKYANSQKDRRLLYCNYKCVVAKNHEELILIEKYPILMASGPSRKKIIKALNMLSEILSCPRELRNISLLLRLAWQTGVKT